MKCKLLFVIGATFAASVATAAPSPPPPPEDVAALRTFIAAIAARDAKAYAQTLSDNVIVTQDGRQIASGKVQWMVVIRAELEHSGRSVKPEGVWIGFNYADRAPRGSLDQALISERIDEVFGDCCVYHRTEILTFEKGKIGQLDISRAFATQLQNDGRRQEDR